MERLQRIMAARGVASRRAAEELIRAGRVMLDGVVVTELGTKADPVRSVIKVDGKALKAQRPRYILLNKPRGYITTVKDERDRRTVMDLVTVSERVFPVGRLDRDTEGLLLLTNDGDVANRVMHPRYGLDKEYQVLTLTRPSEAVLQRLRAGVRIDGKLVVPDEVRIARETNEGLILKIVVHEGINHLVRRMMEEVGIPLERLRRVRLGPLSIAGVPVGVWRELSPGELDTLLQAVQLDQAEDLQARERTKRYSTARADARRTEREPKAPRPRREDALDELAEERPARRPSTPMDQDGPRRAPRGDRFALMRQARRERRQSTEQYRQTDQITEREQSARDRGGYPNPRKDDERNGRGFAPRGRDADDAPRRFERDQREQRPSQRREDDRFAAPSGTRERGVGRDARGERGPERRGPRDDRANDQPRGGRGFARDPGERDDRRDAGERHDDRDQRGGYTPRRERGEARRRDDDRRPSYRDHDDRPSRREAFDDGRGRTARQDRPTDERTPRPRRYDDEGDRARRPPARTDERGERRDRDERERPFPAGPRAPRRPFGGRREADERQYDGLMNQRGARDEQERQPPSGDRDRRSGGGREDDRRSRPRRPARRDLP